MWHFCLSRSTCLPEYFYLIEIGKSGIDLVLLHQSPKRFSVFVRCVSRLADIASVSLQNLSNILVLEFGKCLGL